MAARFITANLLIGDGASGLADLVLRDVDAVGHGGLFDDR